MSPTRSRALRQLAGSYLITNGLVFALSRPAPMRHDLHELIGALFLIAGLVSVRRDDDDTTRYGIRLGGIFPGRAGDDRSLVRAVVEAIPSACRELVIAVAICALILPVYAFFWPMFNPVPSVRLMVLDRAHWQQLITTLLAVALTEELYFRGYVLTRVADCLDVPMAGGLLQRLRAMALPIVITAALFAATHVTVNVTLARAVVFFPGILFGVVRVWRGGIGAAVFVHAISNAFESWLEGS